MSTHNRTVFFVCVAHFLSHFYLMLLPPLFPVLSETLDVGYTELGFALTGFSLLSGLTQAPIGFLVDRYGPRYILIAGVCLEGIAIGLIGIFPFYGVFLLLLGIAGIANSVYHPADYSILNSIASEGKVGRTFSYHTASGMLGEAIGPATILLLAVIIDWRLALIILGLLGVIISFALLFNIPSKLNSQASEANIKANNQKGIKLLFTAPIVLGLLFFVGISIFHRGITGFSVSALHEGHGLSVEVAGILLSAWLFSTPVGVLVGGRIADRNQNHAIVISICFLMISICVGLIVIFAPNLWGCAVLFAIAGFFAGIVSPSRDMLIRSVTPPGQFGKVFGFVSTGFNIGGILAPPIYGYVHDQGKADFVFIIVALVSLLTILTVFGASRARTAS